MNFLNVFEERISSLFTATAADASPVSFKKLAREASKELQNETYVIDGVDTAPALFTILINGADNKQMGAIQADLANETALFLEAAGKRKKYAFVGKPLVRFMVDSSLKPGKFSVFAENIDADTLEKLRAEEESYLGGRPSRETTYGDEFDAIGQSPVAEPPQNPEEQYAPETPELSGHSARASRRTDASSNPQTRKRKAPTATQGAPRAAAANRSAAAGAAAAASAAGAAGAARAAGAANAAHRPAARGRNVALVNPRFPAQQPAVPPEHTAMLIDRQTGQTFTCTTEECIIGRERSAGGIVLSNPNISRHHAKLSFNGRYWAIEDLGSTNGTLVNNVDVQKTRLSAGDVITLGLTNLEFMEG